jgi:transcriptional antiterminator RfaH
MNARSIFETEFSHSDHARTKWFCVRTHPKHEHVAAAHLRQDPELEVFLPRIRFRRLTRLGPSWTTEALFQNYLFAKFQLETHLRRVKHSRAVRDVVHFGSRWPVVPDASINELRQVMGEQELRVISDEPQIGESVRIASGPFSGLEAVVSRVMPGPQRIAVLLEFLGRQTAVELSCEQILRHDIQLYPACLACA